LYSNNYWEGKKRKPPTSRESLGAEGYEKHGVYKQNEKNGFLVYENSKKTLHLTRMDQFMLKEDFAPPWESTKEGRTKEYSVRAPRRQEIHAQSQKGQIGHQSTSGAYLKELERRRHSLKKSCREIERKGEKSTNNGSARRSSIQFPPALSPMTGPA